MLFVDVRIPLGVGKGASAGKMAMGNVPIELEGRDCS